MVHRSFSSGIHDVRQFSESFESMEKHCSTVVKKLKMQAARTSYEAIVLNVTLAAIIYPLALFALEIRYRLIMQCVSQHRIESVVSLCNIFRDLLGKWFTVADSPLC